MVRVTNSVASRRRWKRIRKQAKGFVGDRKNHLRLTKEAVMKARAYNYQHRKDNKGNFRRLWITRIGIASRIHGISYSKFMNGLKRANCELNRKVLAEMAVRDPNGFAEVVALAKGALVSA